MKESKIFYNRLTNKLKTKGIIFEEKGNSSKRFDIDVFHPLKERLERIFEIEIEDEYFSEVCNGTGEEINKIDSIWSSSLLSFLVFYSGIKNGGIDIEINNEKVHFNEVYFEFLNPTFKNNPRLKSKSVSNMDCVLMNDKKDIILFIESKFKEYVTDVGNKNKLSNKYLNDDFTKDISVIYKNIINDEKEHYNYGLKQLVTHYSGLQNFKRDFFHNEYKKDDADRRKDIIKAKNDGAQFYFMEIVYDLSDIGYESEYNDYKDLSNKLELEMKKEVNVLEFTTYQKLVKMNYDKIGEKIKEFYKF